MFMHRTRQPWTTYLGYAFLGVCTWLLLALIDPVDYHYFSNATHAWLQGRSSLYDASSIGFFYAPWTLILLVPLAPLSDRFGQAAVNLLSLVSITWGIRVLAEHCTRRSLLLALASPFTASILLLGEWDGLLVGGAALGWYALVRRRPWLLGVALLLLTTKPTNILLVLPLLVWGARQWQWGEWLQMLALPVLIGAASFLACGAEWPARYLQFVRAYPPQAYNISIWQYPFGVFIGGLVAVWLGWYVVQRGISGKTIAFALLGSMMLSPFVAPYHYIGTLPILVVLLECRPRIGLLLWTVAVVGFVTFARRWTDVPLVLYLLALVALYIYDAHSVKQGV